MNEMLGTITLFIVVLTIAILLVGWMILRITARIMNMRRDEPMLFVIDQPSTIDYDRFKPPTLQTPDPTPVNESEVQRLKNQKNATPFQLMVKEILLRRNKQISINYVDKNCLHIKRHGKLIGVVYCYEHRVKVKHVQQVIDARDQHQLDTAYIISNGKFDKPAQKMALVNKLIVITGDKLKQLKATTGV